MVTPQTGSAGYAAPVSIGRSSRRAGTALGLVIALLWLAPAAAGSSVTTSTSAAQELADKFAPIVMMRSQDDGLCDKSEEQYGPPTSVELLLNNPKVRLLFHNARGTRLVKRAPAAADLAGFGEGYYLDLPGNPLRPDCTYAKAFAALKRAGHAPAVTYTHIAHQPGHSGFVLQYWFFYYFNQFNDLHEGDWEGMQIAFDVATPAEALTASPTEIVVFQHSGGEHAGWDDPRVEKEGSHPVVYSAAGSHATFYGSALYLGNGQNGSGVGCDNTTKPLTTYRPRAVLLPDEPPSAGRSPGSMIRADGASGRPASTTDRRDRTPRGSGASRSRGWTRPDPSALRCRPERWSGHPSPVRSAARSRTSPDS